MNESASGGDGRGRILPVYDFRLAPGAAALVRDRERGPGVAGRAPGDGVLLIQFPRFAWKGDPDARPARRLAVRVEPRP